MSLSSLIVQRQLATMRQVEEALARQVIYGGDLVTNLLEVALVDEAVLVDLLSASIQLPPAPAGELPRAPDAARLLFPAEVAGQTVSMPIEVRGRRPRARRRRAIACRKTKQQLALSLGMRIVERAAPAVRVWQAIAKDVRHTARPAHATARRPPCGRRVGCAPHLSRLPSARRWRPRSHLSKPGAVRWDGLPPLPQSAHSTVAGAASMAPGPRRHSTLKTFPTERPPPTLVQPPPV
jgi:hypothetical protein